MSEKIKPDWWCVAINETGHWTIDEKDKPYIEKITGVYFYDRNEHTYCCEITPSYYLRYLCDSIWFTSDTPDNVREELIEKYELYQGEDCYMHVSDVERIDGAFKHHYGAADGVEPGDDQEAFVREYYQGNSPF